MSAHPTVVTTVTDQVADVRLNRPGSLNAVDDGMFTAIIETAARLRADESIRAVVLSGEGRGFCAGLDVTAFGAMRDEGAGWSRRTLSSARWKSTAAWPRMPGAPSCFRA